MVFNLLCMAELEIYVWDDGGLSVAQMVARAHLDYVNDCVIAACLRSVTAHGL